MATAGGLNQMIGNSFQIHLIKIRIKSVEKMLFLAYIFYQNQKGHKENGKTTLFRQTWTNAVEFRK